MPKKWFIWTLNDSRLPGNTIIAFSSLRQYSLLPSPIAVFGLQEWFNKLATLGNIAKPYFLLSKLPPEFRDIFYSCPDSRHNVNIGKCYQIFLYDIAAFLRGFWWLSLILPMYLRIKVSKNWISLFTVVNITVRTCQLFTMGQFWWSTCPSCPATILHTASAKN